LAGDVCGLRLELLLPAARYRPRGERSRPSTPGSTPAKTRCGTVGRWLRAAWRACGMPRRGACRRVGRSSGPGRIQVLVRRLGGANLRGLRRDVGGGALVNSAVAATVRCGIDLPLLA